MIYRFQKSTQECCPTLKLTVIRMTNATEITSLGIKNEESHHDLATSK